VAVLEEIAATLAKTTDDPDVEWLRPLAVLTVEIEYSSLRRPTIDTAMLVAKCGEVRDLLASSSAQDPFASRYELARKSSPSVAQLHDRALAVCQSLL
jgi:hypothetical protein